MSASLKRTTHYQSNVRSQKWYTTYKWCLEDWSMLRNEYEKGVSSPRFKLTNTGGCECSLYLQASSNIESSYIRITFHHVLQFRALQAICSVVDEKMVKLKTAEKTVQELDRYYQMRVEFNSSSYYNYSAKNITEYLRNNTLTTFVELVMIKDIEDSFVSTVNYNPSFGTDVCKELAEIYEWRELNDVTFDVRGTKLYANKAILVSASSVFKAMFRSGMSEAREGVVYIVDIDVIVFEAFLKYLYTGQVDDIEAIGSRLSAVADKYDVFELKKLLP